MRKIAESPLFRFVDIFSLQTTLCGTKSIAKSEMVLNTAIAIYIAPVFQHLPPPGLIRCHVLSIGVQLNTIKKNIVT